MVGVPIQMVIESESLMPKHNNHRWMQIGFLLYHYFEAKEYYNVIRVLIASYVWMTGFGMYIDGGSRSLMCVCVCVCVCVCIPTIYPE